MKKISDVVVALGLGVLLIIANEFGLLEKWYMFAFVPMYAMYFLGKYIAKKYEVNEDEK